MEKSAFFCFFNTEKRKFHEKGKKHKEKAVSDMEISQWQQKILSYKYDIHDSFGARRYDNTSDREIYRRFSCRGH